LLFYRKEVSEISFKSDNNTIKETTAKETTIDEEA